MATAVSVLDEDNCVINIGFLKAHFTIYQPEEGGNTEYCESLPVEGESLFVLEYMHDFLREMPVDFRVTARYDWPRGSFANWGDVKDLVDDRANEHFYQQPQKNGNGVLQASMPFNEPGWYIGVVTAEHPTEDKIYRAVFPFEVGGRDWGQAPYVIALLILVQLAFWWVYRIRQRAHVAA